MKVAATTANPTVQEPTPGRTAYIEMDSNAYTCCLGASFIVLEHTQRCANVYPYDDTMSPVVVPIVNGATAYDFERSGQTYILVVNEALYCGVKLKHSLFNQNQIRSFGNLVWDNPFDDLNQRPLGIELQELFVPIHKGNEIIFPIKSSD